MNATTRRSAVVPPFRSADYWLSFALFVCALLSKTVTATLPAALLLVLWWQRGRLEWRRDVLPLVPWFAIAAIAGAFTIWFEHDDHRRARRRLHAHACRAAAPRRPCHLVLSRQAVLAGRSQLHLSALDDRRVGVVAVSVLDRGRGDGRCARRSARRSRFAPLRRPLAGRRGPLAGYLFFCRHAGPRARFRQRLSVPFFLCRRSLSVSGESRRHRAGCERPGACHPRDWAWRCSAVLAAALIVMLGVLTWNRSACLSRCRDAVSRHDRAESAGVDGIPESRHRAGGQESPREAIDAYEGALRARPDYPASQEQSRAGAHEAWRCRRRSRRTAFPSAIWHYESVLRLEPDHFRAHYNLGTLLMDLPERHAEAITHLESAVRFSRRASKRSVNLGVVLADVPARSREAIEHLEIALAKRPDLTPCASCWNGCEPMEEKEAETEDQKIRRSEIRRSNINRNRGHLSRRIPIWMV